MVVVEFKRDAMRLLERARQILDQPSHWTKRYPARDVDDYDVTVDSPDAVKFCLSGAVSRALWEWVWKDGDKPNPQVGAHEQAKAMLVHVIENRTDLRFTSIVGFNDHEDRTYHEVLSVLDVAINELRRQVAA